jgi:hypothetical protein
MNLIENEQNSLRFAVKKYTGHRTVPCPVYENCIKVEKNSSALLTAVFTRAIVQIGALYPERTEHRTCFPMNIFDKEIVL